MPDVKGRGRWYGPAWYVVRVRGRIDAAWSHLFGGFTITHDSVEDTLISGQAADQAVFYGLMSRARDLGLTVLAVERREDFEEDVQGTP